MTGVKKDRLYFTVIIAIQLGICIFAGTYKKNFFCDEIFSYGLANSGDYTFIDPASADGYSSTGWVDDEYFRGYIEADHTEGLSFQAAFRNQEKDVHPPFYYCLLHLVCWLYKGSFSKWTGIGLNLAVLVFADLLFLYIANELYQDKKKSVFALMLWSCSAAGLSNILFIRMYLLLTCEMLAFVALHLLWMKKKGRTGLKIKDAVVLLLLTAFGGLTHYYFYLFVFFFSGVICICLLIGRRFQEMLKYGTALAGGGLLAIAVFPVTVAHIFKGYRGTEVWGNLSGREENVYSVYFQWVDQSIFGGYFWLVIFIFTVIAVWKVIRQFFAFSLERGQLSQNIVLQIRKMEKHTDGYCVRIKPVYLLFLLLLFACVMFGMVAAKGSGLLSNRYIYPVYPVIAMGMVMLAGFCIRQTAGRRHENKILLCMIMVLCVLSVRTYGIDFLYANDDSFKSQAEQVTGNDCLLYYGDDWLDVYTAFPFKLIYDETYFLHPDEIGNLVEILQTRETADPVVVCLPDQWKQEEAEGMLRRIMEAGGFTGYQMIYHYYTQAYLMQ